MSKMTKVVRTRRPTNNKIKLDNNDDNGNNEKSVMLDVLDIISNNHFNY